MPSNIMSLNLPGFTNFKRTYPPDRESETITAVQLWQLLHGHQIAIRTIIPNAPPEFQRALAERKTFADLWGTEDIELFGNSSNQHSLVKGEPASPSTNSSVLGQHTAELYFPPPQSPLTSDLQQIHTSQVKQLPPEKDQETPTPNPVPKFVIKTTMKSPYPSAFTQSPSGDFDSAPVSGAEFYSAGVPYEPVAPRELDLLCRLD
ncbi:uncharacterized protein PAC_10179 [Phialocephala subalpina]|uniref:Uncharacterized protein n=1 Tax=Phialocephala subalpina TaxID=576137 RepID=A0A1L7X5J1_9HELO|nr:uncharacterized protein PAC_10179 [Phialocephala subalpina]